ncbi:MAG: hypothetical protein ACLPH3_23125 [Terracidiphilus sp.]
MKTNRYIKAVYLDDRLRVTSDVPAQHYYIPAHEIVNLNVRFPTVDPSKDEEFEAFLDSLLKSVDAPQGTTFTFEPPKAPDTPFKPIDSASPADPEVGAPSG